jgi:hypothetical protein
LGQSQTKDLPKDLHRFLYHSTSLFANAGSAYGQAAAKVTDVLSASVLRRMSGAGDGKVQQYLDELELPDQYRLWKKFEANRKVEGSDEEYRAATAGLGRVDTTRSLLKFWIQGGLSTKSQC